MGFHDAAPAGSLEPGSTAMVTVGGFPVALANVDGEYYAFQNLCPHQGFRLGGRPLVNGCQVVCARHSSRFDVTTGRCLQPSSLDGFAQDLMTFPTRVTDGVVQVDV